MASSWTSGSRATTITREQAVVAFTRDSAVALGIAATLRTGLSADFIVDRNVFEVPVGQMHRTVVEETWFRGELVYDAAD